MSSLLRNSLLGATAAVSFFMAAPATEAATLINDGDVVSISYGDEFFGNVEAAGGAGSFTVQFDATSDPIKALASATIGPIVAGTFTNLVMSWVAVSDGFVLGSISVVPSSVSLTTIFTQFGVLGGDDSKQWLTLTWDDSQAGAGFDVEVAAAVPLPAGGLLLIGGLGALAALRRRKAAA